MGRHSNIILTHNADNKIIDSAKRIPTSVSRARQILPGLTYELPPSQDKLNPLNNISQIEFTESLISYDGPIFKGIYSKFLGISPIVSKEICFRANINENTSYELTNNRHLITFVTKINKDKIYEDLFKKLGE